MLAGNNLKSFPNTNFQKTVTLVGSQVGSSIKIYWNISLKVREHGVVSSATFNSHGLSRPNSLRDFFKFGLVAFSIDATVPMYKVLFFPLIVVVTPGFLI